MPNVNLKKADKMHALRAMIDAKFKRRYDKGLEAPCKFSWITRGEQ